MTDKRPSRLGLRGLAWVLPTAALCALLAGCGGTTTNPTLLPFVASGPTIYGVQYAPAPGKPAGETSGVGTTNYLTGYVTGAVASNAVPPVGIASANGGTIPLGFWQGGQYIDQSFGQAAPPSSSVAFAVDISNGNTKSGVVIKINPNSVVISNIPSNAPDFPADDTGVAPFSFPLHFKFPLASSGGNPTGPFSDCTYTTDPFTLPFTTTGLHGVRASVADKAGNNSYTDFYTLVLAGTDSAVLVQIVDANSNPVQGASVSITNALAGVTAYGAATGSPISITDKQGVAIVFASPGSQTITATKAAATGNDTETLTAGQVFDNVTILTGTPPTPQTVPYTITIQ